MRFLWRKRVLIPTVILAAVALSLVPLPVRDVDKDTAVRKTLSASLSGRPVFVDWKYVPFYHFDDGVDPAGLTLYFRNVTNISEEVFTDLGLKPLPKGLDPYAGMASLPPEERFFWENALVLVTYGDSSWDDEKPNSLCFWLQYGELAGQCYRLTIVRTFWGVFVFYKCVGVS